MRSLDTLDVNGRLADRDSLRILYILVDVFDRVDRLSPSEIAPELPQTNARWEASPIGTPFLYRRSGEYPQAKPHP